MTTSIFAVEHVFIRVFSRGMHLRRRTYIISILRRSPMRADAQNLRINRTIHPGDYNLRVWRAVKGRTVQTYKHMTELYTSRFYRGNAAAFLAFYAATGQGQIHLNVCTTLPLLLFRSSDPSGLTAWTLYETRVLKIVDFWRPMATTEEKIGFSVRLLFSHDSIVSLPRPPFRV